MRCSAARRLIQHAIVAALVLIGAVSVATAQDIERVEDGLWSTEEIVLYRAQIASDRLEVKSSENLTGKLTFATWDRDSIKVSYYKQARTDSRSRAIDYIDLISVDLDTRAPISEIELRAPNPAPWSKRAENGLLTATILVPQNTHIDVDAIYHDVDATGPLAALRIPNSLGRIEVRRISGDLDITTANRRIRLEEVAGTISVSTSNATLTAIDVDATSAQARFRNEGGDIEIDGVRGEVNIRNSYGRVSVFDFTPGGESSVIRNSSGLIIVEVIDMQEGQLVVSNRHEDVELTIPDALSAFLSLSVGDGEIECSGFSFTPELVQDNRLNLILGDGAVDMSSTVRGKGNIYVRGVKGE
ncbi:hypothetical protein GF377_02370 [candidate division GN15 bacterium]|nr:hypothetical protein [candidate division GN15 bacterium]